MKLTALILFLLTSVMAYGQRSMLTDEQVNQSGAIKVIFAESAEKAIELAVADIKKGLPFLLLQSGISPEVYPSDNKFEERYQIYYYESGCSGPQEELAIAYNRRMFSYLTEMYGNKWKRDIRKDVIGFKKWRRMLNKNK